MRHLADPVVRSYHDGMEQEKRQHDLDRLPPRTCPLAVPDEPQARAARRVVDCLRDAGWETYVVGGAVRDMILGRNPHEWDIATAAPPETVASAFSVAFLVGKSFGVVKVRLDEWTFDVATFRADSTYSDGRRPDAVTFTSALEDVRRRDFTINGLLFDPRQELVFDHVSGLEDLRARLVRCIGDPRQRFQEDRLRMMRAVRMAAELEFEIEASTWRALAAMAPAITSISVERVRDELLRLLRAPGAAEGLDRLRRCGLLRQILPEVDAMHGVEHIGRHHPEGDVFEHTRGLFRHLHDPSDALAVAALLHDVGKPKTAQQGRFPAHEHVGAKLAGEICCRLRLPKDTTQRVVSMVRQHMKLVSASQMRTSKLKRFLRQDVTADLLELHRADCLASSAPLTHYDFCREQLEQLPEEVLRPPPLVTGHDLIAMGLSPGPLFGEILREVEERQLSGEWRDREQALAAIRARWGA